MSEVRLLASVVLFRELYDSEKDIYDVIGEFIKAAMVFEKKWAFNTTEATQMLTTEFGLNIPEAVVGSTLRNRLVKRDQILTHEGGSFSLMREELRQIEPLIQEFDSIRKQQDEILGSLFDYVKTIKGGLSDIEKDALTDDLCAYLLDNDSYAESPDYVSLFILKNQNNSSFTQRLNAVREGFVLYNGVRYTPDLNELNSWKSEMVVFLDTEHLFSAAGFNGVLYQQLIQDFLSLVNELNRKGKRLISLRYFDECRREADNFFHVAELILDGKTRLDPSKSAMLKILDGANSKSDIVERKAKFFAKLEQLQIHDGETLAPDLDPTYNVESADILSQLKREAEKTSWPFNEQKCVNTLRMFTKINTLRKGINTKSFENVGSVLVSGSSFTRFLAFHAVLKPNEKAIPFATDLEFITNRLWFKLRKGLAKHLANPQSLNVLAKAQVVLSSQLNTSVAGKYDQVQADFSSGKLTKREAEYISNELRERCFVPEELTTQTLGPVLDFLSDKTYENHLREKSHLERSAKEGEEAKLELAAIRSETETKRKLWAKRKIQAIFFSGTVLLVLTVLGTFYLCYLLVNSYRSGQDSLLTVIGFLLTLAFGLTPIANSKRIYRWIRARYIAAINALS